MLLRIFGLPNEPIWWHLSRIPPEGGREIALRLHDAIPSARNLQFFIQDMPLDGTPADVLLELWAQGVGQLVAKPVSSNPSYEPESRLLLLTTGGPDAGRIMPLTREELSVGRSNAQAQIQDPWLSAHDFNIRLSSNGTVITPSADPIHWEPNETFVAGSTSFKLHRGAGTPLPIPHHPGPFEISCGQPPSPPNVILQVIGAAAPLMIGIVLMVVTGMWYFLLFSGVSVIIAVVLIAQYRRARRRFIEKIDAALAATLRSIQASVFTPYELMLAFSAREPDPLALKGIQPDHPVIHLGSGVRKAQMLHVQESQRWDNYLDARVELVIELQPGHRTVIVGQPDMLPALKNWIIAQLLRHVQATGRGLLVDGLHIGGSPVVEISGHLDAAANLSVHHLVFTSDANVQTDGSTTLVDLNRRQVHDTWTATDIVPVGISSILLDRISDELGINHPVEQLSSDYLMLSSPCMQGEAISELMTRMGTGKLGLEMDLVADGPHALITGTTGSGKSELLLTLLAGFAERYPPGEVSMILLDFKGGSSFNVLASLPHIMSVETNHVAKTSLRSLKAIAAELFRRETLFARHQVADYAAFRRSAPEIMLPRLIVAIDELRVLIEQNPEASTTLAHLASTGRSLGFHLVIATQRTQGAVSADIRANISSLICLRTATEHDSWDVLGTADAFSIHRTTPGRAYYKAGASTPQLFQTCRYLLDNEPVIIQPCRTGQTATTPTTTDWPALVQKLEEAADSVPIPAPVLMPALPEHLAKSSLPPLTNDKEAIPIGLVDDPTNSKQYPVYLGQKPGRGDHAVLSSSVAWIGTADSGVTASLDTVARYVLSADAQRIFLDGRHLVAPLKEWDKYLHHSVSTADELKSFLHDLTATLDSGLRVIMVIADWGSWAQALVTGSFQSFEEQLIQLLRQYPTSLTVYAFGGRELAAGRLLGMIPDRFYLPKNSSPEHKMIWPKLVDIPSVTSRAVLVTAENPQAGWEVQLVEDL